MIAAESIPDIIDGSAWRLHCATGKTIPKEDFVQVGMVAAMRALVMQDDDDSFVVRCIRRQAKSAMIDLARQETNFRRKDRPDVISYSEAGNDHILSNAASMEEDTLSIVMKRDMARKVSRAIMSLPSQMMEVLKADLAGPAERAALAVSMGVHKSRISQIKAEAIDLLRIRLRVNDQA